MKKPETLVLLPIKNGTMNGTKIPDSDINACLGAVILIDEGVDRTLAGRTEDREN